MRDDHEKRPVVVQPVFSAADSRLLKARQEVINRRWYFLLWGWAAFTAILIQYILKVVAKWPYHYWVWLGLLPVMAVTIIKRKKEREQQANHSVIGECMRQLWTALGISFFAVSLIAGLAKSQLVYSVFILLYGIGTFVSGQLLKFGLLTAGGILCWPIAVVCSVLAPHLQLLAVAAALLFSYILPAHLLNPNIQSWKTLFRTRTALH